MARHFTKQEIEEIRRQLATYGVRDSEFPEATTVSSEDEVMILQDEKNKRLDVGKIENKIYTKIHDEGIDGKVLSDNNYTTGEKNKLANIQSGAQVNVIEQIKQDGVIRPINNKSVNIDLSDFVHKNLVPAAASPSNKLADKKYVHDEIITSAATFRGTSPKNLTEEQFLAWADTREHDLNDYVYWDTIDDNLIPIYKRYKWDNHEWVFEYVVNNSDFTDAQLAAINSGIDTTHVDKLDDLPTRSGLTAEFAEKQDVIEDLDEIRQNAETGGNAYHLPVSGIPSTDLSEGVNSSLAKAESAIQDVSDKISSDDIDDVIELTQEEFDALATKDPRTLYIVSDSTIESDHVGIASLVQTTVAATDEGINVWTCTLTNNQTFTLQVKNGSKGTSGYSGAAGELEVVNSLDSTDDTAALAASQGKVLDGKITQLGQEVEEIPTSIIRQLIDPSFSGELSFTPTGVIDMGVRDFGNLITNTIVYLTRCHCIKSGTTYTFELRIVDGNSTNLIDKSIDISDLSGAVIYTIGAFLIKYDATVLKENSLASRPSFSIPINVAKLKESALSLIYRNTDADINYFVCPTFGSTADKEAATTANVSVTTGYNCFLKFNSVNTATGSVTLKISNTGTAYPLFYNGVAVSDTNTWSDGEIVLCVFDGTNFNLYKLPKDFAGTNGSTSGVAGFVPAPASSDANKFLSSNGGWERNDGYFVDTTVSINNNSQRTKTFTLNPGSKIVVRVSLVSGTSKTYNLSWIKSGGNESVYSGMPLGFMSDVLTVPNDATGVSMFISPSASGNQARIEIFNASNAFYLTQKVTADEMNYLDYRKVLSFSKEVVVSESSQEILTVNDAVLHQLIGDIYVYIEDASVIDQEGAIAFYDEDNASVSLTGLELRQQKLFKIFTNKRLARILIPADSVASAGTVSFECFAIEPSLPYVHYPLIGKKIICFGDSVTEFKSGIDNKRYSDHLALISQAITYNIGIGGTRLAPRDELSLTPSGQQQAIAAFEISPLIDAWATDTYNYQDAAVESGELGSDYQTRFENKLSLLKSIDINDVDMVIIWGGHNDYRGGTTIGSKVYDNYDIYTLCGAVNNSIKKLLAANSKLQIYMIGFMPTMFGENYSDDYTPSYAPVYDGNALSWPDYSEFIHDLAKLNHVPFLNWYWDCGMNRYNREEYYIEGDNHPYKGFQYIAEKIYKFLLAK